MEYIDILMPPYGLDATFGGCSYFTVDTSTASVPVTTVGGTLGIWGLTGFRGKFQERDNLRILTAGYYMPESFTPADTPHAVGVQNSNALRIQVYNSTNTAPVADLPFNSSTNGFIGLPFLNYEMALDSFVNMAGLFQSLSLSGNDYYLRCSLYFNDISMIGVPSRLDNTVQKIIPFIKVLHTKPII